MEYCFAGWCTDIFFGEIDFMYIDIKTSYFCYRVGHDVEQLLLYLIAPATPLPHYLQTTTKRNDLLEPERGVAY